MGVTINEDHFEVKRRLDSYNFSMLFFDELEYKMAKETFQAQKTYKLGC